MVDFRSNFTLEPLNSKHADGLLTIVTDPEVMQYIADGETWDDKKLGRAIQYSEKEWSEWSENNGASWAIMTGEGDVHNKVSGMVQIIPPKRGNVFHKKGPIDFGTFSRKNYSLRVFLDTKVQGKKRLEGEKIVKGIGTRASIQAIEYFRVFNADKLIDIIVHKGNVPSIKSMNKVLAYFYGKSSEDIAPKDAKIGGKDVTIKTMHTLRREECDEKTYLREGVEYKTPKDYPYHTCFIPPAPVLVQSLISQYNNFSSTEIGSGSGTFSWGSGTDRESTQLAFVKRKFPEQVLFADVLTDWFVEHERLQCIFGSKNISPLQFFENYKSEIEKSSNPFIYRENIRKYAKKLGAKTGQKNIGKECNLFNLYLSLTLVDPYNFLEKKYPQYISDYWGNLEIKSNEIKMVRGPGHVLDPAAGWGDRLISSILAGAFSYTGFDTNEDLQPVYKSIVNSPVISKAYEDTHKAKFSPREKDGEFQDKFIVHPEPFEGKRNVITGEVESIVLGKYDTIITSPPFFNVEIYKGDRTSTTSYKTKEKWLTNYYRPMWEKCVRTLKPLGRIITYIAPWMFEDTYNAIMASSSDMVYLGHVDFVQFNSEDQIMDPRNHRPAFIWRYIPTEYKDEFGSDLGSHTPPGTPPGPPPGTPPGPPAGTGPKTPPGPGKLPFEKFNDFVITQLLERHRGYYGESSLLDMSSGQGEDIGKWCDSRYTKVVGLDLNQDNVNKANQIYSNIKLTCATKMVFIAGDSSKPIFPEHEAGADEANKRLIETHIPENKFDVVSMQFAIHRMFESKAKLEKFIRNISDTLKPGGMFIGTTFDGKKVLETLGTNTSINSTKPDGEDIWNVKRVKSIKKGFGALGKISVRTQSAEEREEYLVDFDTFTKIMTNNGFTPEGIRGFDDYYSEYESYSGGNVPDDQKDFSFLNSTFAFRKGGYFGEPKIDDPCTCCSDFKDI